MRLARIAISTTLLVDVACAYCPGDATADGFVNVDDLTTLLAAWGDCPVNSPCRADFDDNGKVDITDLLELLAAWNGCAGPESGFLANWVPRTPPPFENTSTGWLTGEGLATTVTVDAGNDLRRIPPALRGNNVAVWTPYNYYFNPVALDRLRAIQVPVLRYPGGSTSDHFHWDEDYSAIPEYQNYTNPWTTNFQEYIELLDAVGGARPMLTVNYGFVNYGNLSAAAELAASWVEYCNAPADGSNPGGGVDWAQQRVADGFPDPLGFRYWEIGNEIYGSWGDGYEPDGTIYAANWHVIRDAMKAIDPTIMVGLVTHSADQGNPDWAGTVLGHPGPDGRPTGDTADFLIVHEYFHFGDLPVDEVMDNLYQVGENANFLDDLLLTHTNRFPGDVPYALTEYNTCSHDVEAAPNQLVSGLFISAVLGELMTTGWMAANYWDVANGWNQDGEGDHGMLAKNHPGINNFTPYAGWYAFYLFAQGCGDTLVASTSSNDIMVYASTFDDEQIGLILINPTDSPHRIEFDINGFSGSGSWQAWCLSGSALDASQLTLNGIPGTASWGGPEPAAAPPYALSGAPGDVPAVTVPARSVTALVGY